MAFYPSQEFNVCQLIGWLVVVWFSYQSVQLDFFKICLRAAGRWRAGVGTTQVQHMTSLGERSGVRSLPLPSRKLMWELQSVLCSRSAVLRKFWMYRRQVKMDFLKKIVPTVASGDVVLEVGSSVRENSPRLLKMRRVSLLSLGQTIDEDQEIHVLHPHFRMYPCHQADN